MKLHLSRLPFRTRLTAWYVLILSLVLLVFIAGSALIFYWLLQQQISHFAVQDIETVEGLLYIDQNGKLSLREDYHNHPESRYLLERLLEIVSPDGKILYRNQRLGSERLGGLPFPGEGVDVFSERSGRLSDGSRITLVSRYYSLHGLVMVIRLAYRNELIWVRIQEFVTACFIAFPFLVSAAAFLGYHLSKRALFPLEKMARQAERITVDRLGERLPIEHPGDELGQLARVFNSVLDRLEQSFQQLRRFTSDASHELRTPLAAIRSVGEVGLQKNSRADEFRETVGSMLEEVGRLTKLVDTLLTISRSDAGQTPVHLSPIFPLDVVDEVTTIVQVLADERGQSISILGERNLQIMGDSLLLQQALLNLLHNAVKFSDVRGAIDVSVAAGNGRVTIKVSDSGPGIAAEHLERIFDRFYRIDTGRTREAGGTGLGLSITKWAVEAQNGQIHVESDSSGATFVLDFPLLNGS